MADELQLAFDFYKDEMVTEEEVDEAYQKAIKAIEELELMNMLRQKEDPMDCVLKINSGAGGTEAQDWAQMLMRMYMRWAEAHGYKVTISSLLDGEDAGIKSVTMQIEGGEYAYGFLKAEKGVHRLVRISPFDSAHRRHTSFASVLVSPEISDDVDIEIKPEDLKVDTFRASGAGGQYVNRTDSAIRITHIPTGIVVTCQNERSQHMNRATAMHVLKSRLYDMAVHEREEELASVVGDKKEAAWGSQIRSYVLHPYTLVKDHRTNYEKGNIQSVLDGDINGFIMEYLKQRARSNV